MRPTVQVREDSVLVTTLRDIHDEDLGDALVRPTTIFESDPPCGTGETPSVIAEEVFDVTTYTLSSEIQVTQPTGGHIIGSHKPKAVMTKTSCSCALFHEE